MTQDLKRRLYAYFANKSNQTSEEKLLMSELEGDLPYFEITSVAREDLEDYGFDTTDISDDIMERIASKLSDAYISNGFWIDLDIIADCEGLVKNGKTTEEDD